MKQQVAKYKHFTFAKNHVHIHTSTHSHLHTMHLKFLKTFTDEVSVDLPR